jgi:hypothetical protein
MDTKYYTLEFTVQPYDWQIHMMEPTMAEFIELKKALASETDKPEEALAKEEALLVKLVRPPWTCTDRAGKLLPCDLTGIQQLPRSVASAIIWKMVRFVEEPSDPKEKTKS